MVKLYIFVMAYPFVAKLNFFYSRKEPSEQCSQQLRIGFISLTRFNQRFQLSDSFFTWNCIGIYSTADYCSCQFVTIFCNKLTCYDGAHAVSEHKIRDIRVFFLNQLFEPVLVLHHRLRSIVSPVSPGVIDDGCLAVPHMIICCNNVAGVHHFAYHVEISSGMFTESVNQLYNSLYLCCRYIYPSLYIITFIVRKKTNFMQHMIHLLFIILMFNILLCYCSDSNCSNLLVLFYHGRSSASITAFVFCRL